MKLIAGLLNKSVTTREKLKELKVMYKKNAIYNLYFLI